MTSYSVCPRSLPDGSFRYAVYRGGHYLATVRSTLEAAAYIGWHMDRVEQCEEAAAP